jgi:hypothetical protein
MDFEIVGAIRDVQIIATGKRIRELIRLKRAYGIGRWRKMKGLATIQTAEGIVRQVEVHWYEAHGIGKKEYKIKES